MFLFVKHCSLSVVSFVSPTDLSLRGKIPYRYSDFHSLNFRSILTAFSIFFFISLSFLFIFFPCQRKKNWGKSHFRMFSRIVCFSFFFWCLKPLSSFLPWICLPSSFLPLLRLLTQFLPSRLLLLLSPPPPAFFSSRLTTSYVTWVRGFISCLADVSERVWETAILHREAEEGRRWVKNLEVPSRCIHHLRSFLQGC